MLRLLLLLISLLSLISPTTPAQLRDDFTDGNFTQNPAWTGDATSFQVNAGRQLQSAGPALTGTQLQLSTPCAASTGTSWEFWANLRLATSSGNYADVYLLASKADLKSLATSGYFVRLGGTNDEISLFRRDSTRSPVLIIDGQNQTLSSATSNLVRVRVTRTTDSRWTLERDLSGGRTFTAEANSPTDATYQRSQAMGVLLTYSSANRRNFYFDDFVVTDASAPRLLQAVPASSREVDLLFNEALDLVSAGLPANYRLLTGAAPLSAQVSAHNSALVRLTFGADFGALNTLEVRQVADLFGNVPAAPLTASFAGPAVTPLVGDLIISEILADETPTVGLPPSEFVEIYNRSLDKVLSLKGVRLLKPGSLPAAGFADTARLLPGQYAVVCGSTRVAQFAGLGAKVYGLTNFPSLSNAGDQLVLRGADGQTLFEVSYTDAWYRDPRQKDGGYSLEMRDVDNYCASAENWTASPDPSGGTPGRRNAATAGLPDRLAPTLLRAVAVDARTVRAFFSEKLDSAAASKAGFYRLGSLTSAAPAVLRAAPVPYNFRAVDLTLASALAPSQLVSLRVQQATDCAGNASGPLQEATFALPEMAAPGDLVIHEILFNPRVGAVDFVEILNRSTKYVALQGYQVANEKPDKTLDAAPVSAEPYVLAPGQLVVFTEKPAVLQTQYPTSTDPAALLAVPGFPTLPDDAGTVLLLDSKGQELDRYAYHKNQQLSLLTSPEGVSLERIRASGPSQPENFHSAAASVGYATPGRPNSQAQDAPGGNQELTLTPEIFTPDEDGQQDFCTLSYQLDQPGYVASISVYDALGRPTRQLLRNQTLATTGLVQWDGVDDHGHKAAVGYYVLVIQLFRPSGGEKREYKKTVVVGARF